MNRRFQQGYSFTYFHTFCCLLLCTYFLFGIFIFFFSSSLVKLQCHICFICTLRLPLATSQSLFYMIETSAIYYVQCCCFQFCKNQTLSIFKPAFFPAHLDRDISSSNFFQNVNSSKPSLWHSTVL
jgi:hypothetical protein